MTARHKYSYLTQNDTALPPYGDFLKRLFSDLMRQRSEMMMDWFKDIRAACFQAAFIGILI